MAVRPALGSLVTDGDGLLDGDGLFVGSTSAENKLHIQTEGSLYCRSPEDRLSQSREAEPVDADLKAETDSSLEILLLRAAHCWKMKQETLC